MKNKLLALLLFTLFVMPAAGQNADEENSADDGPSAPDLMELIDYNKSNNTKNGFSAHKQNYFLPVSYSGLNVDDGRIDHEIKFQISFKQRLLKFYGWAGYFGYTQKSFWQAYDLENSRPFRENNFNPEFFVRTKMWSGFRADFGAEHESNGRDMPKSRSWNRVYAMPYFENDYIIASIKGWYRIKEKKKVNALDVSGDDNPDIYKYYGYGEFGFTVKFPELRKTYLSTVLRYHPKYNKGSAEVNLTIPLSMSSMNVMVHYWEGYGESLVDYNLRQRKIGVGLNFTR